MRRIDTDLYRKRVPIKTRYFTILFPCGQMRCGRCPQRCSLRSGTEFPEYVWIHVHFTDPMELAGAEMIAADQAVLVDAF